MPITPCLSGVAMSCVSVPCRISGTGPAPVPTAILPAIQGWMIQMYGLVPAVANTTVNVSPGSFFPLSNAGPAGTMIAEPNGAAARAVTVWVVLGSLKCQVTLSPALMRSWTGVNHGWNLPTFTGWSNAQDAEAPNTIRASNATLANPNLTVLVFIVSLPSLRTEC